MKIELNKDDKEFIRYIQKSHIDDKQKGKLINMVKANRMITNSILEELSLTKETGDKGE